MRFALEELPWVQEGSVEADVRRQRVRFAIKDRAAFNLGLVKQAIAKAGFRAGELIAGP